MLYETIESKTAQCYTRKYNLCVDSLVISGPYPPVTPTVRWIGLPKNIFQYVIKKML